MILPCLFIAAADQKGRGIFTRENIDAGTLIEVSPVIVMSGQDRELIDQTPLHDYIFEWGSKHGQCCMALGYLSLYNHSYHANCEYEMDYELEIISIRTVRFIAAGDELNINYNGDWNSKKPVWFQAT